MGALKFFGKIPVKSNNFSRDCSLHFKPLMTDNYSVVIHATLSYLDQFLLKKELSFPTAQTRKPARQL